MTSVIDHATDLSGSSMCGDDSVTVQNTELSVDLSGKCHSLISLPQAASTERSPPEFPNWPMWLVVVCMLTLGVGVSGNCWILYRGLGKTTLRRSSFHVLLVNHSVANLIISCSHIARVVRAVEGLALQDSVCTLWGFVMCWVGCVSLLTNGVIALNRALACHPWRKISYLLRTRGAVLVILTCVWIFFLVYFLLPICYILGEWNALFDCQRLEPVPEGQERPIWKARYFIQAGFGVSAALTLVMCVASYGAILRYLYCGMGQLDSASLHRRREKLRALAMIVVVFLVLILCWTPVVFFLLSTPRELSQYYVLHWLPMLDTALMPCIYVVSMPAYRPWNKRQSRTSQSFASTN